MLFYKEGNLGSSHAVSLLLGVTFVAATSYIILHEHTGACSFMYAPRTQDDTDFDQNMWLSVTVRGLIICTLSGCLPRQRP